MFKARSFLWIMRSFHRQKMYWYTRAIAIGIEIVEGNYKKWELILVFLAQSFNIPTTKDQLKITVN